MTKQLVHKKRKYHEKIGSMFGFFDNSKTKSELNEQQEGEFLNILKEAHTEWKNAELYFESVTESDLIDHAIYKMEAARTKYIYLLKQARNRSVKIDS